MTSRNWLMQAADLLAALNAPDARADAEWMLADAMGIGRGEIRLRLNHELTEREYGLLTHWMNGRLAGLPLQYAQRRAYFMGLEFYVDERVLIPRPDTEILCEQALERIDAQGFTSALDLCTGSGALAVAIKKLRPNVAVTASDISKGALQVARLNAAKQQVSIELLQGDLFEPLNGRRFDLIVCNPPYLSESDMNELQSEVTKEPELALRGGEDGYAFYRRIAASFRDHLNPGGCVLLEVGIHQSRRVAEMLGEGAVIHKDLSGIERVVGIQNRA